MRTAAKVRDHPSAPRPSPLAFTRNCPHLLSYERLYADARTHRLESCVLWNQASTILTMLTMRYCAPGEYYAAVFTLDDSEVQCRL